MKISLQIILADACSPGRVLPPQPFDRHISGELPTLDNIIPESESQYGDSAGGYNPITAARGRPRLAVGPLPRVRGSRCHHRVGGRCTSGRQGPTAGSAHCSFRGRFPLSPPRPLSSVPLLPAAFPRGAGPPRAPPVRSHPAPGSRVPPSCPRPSASPARRMSGCPSVLVPGRATFAWSLHALGRSTRSGSLALLPRLLGRLAHERAHQSLRLRACRQGATPKPQHTELPTAWRSQAPAGTEARGRGDCREGASDFPAVQSCWRTASSALGSGWGNRACEQIPGSARCGNLGEVGGPASLQPDPWSLQATPAALPSSPDSGVRPTEYIPSWSHSPTTFRGDWQPVVGLEGEEAALGGGW